MTKKSKTVGDSIHLWAYVNVFKADSWATIAATLVAIATGLLLAKNVLNANLNRDSEDFGLLNALGVQVLIMMTLDYPLLEKTSLTVRVLYYTVSVYSLVLVAYYSGFLTSLVTSGTAPSPITR